MDYTIERNHLTISIHALVKRATIPTDISEPARKNFNPRPREEGDQRRTGKADNHSYFNPRPREEGDSTIMVINTAIRYFNPRPREEGDDFES